MGIPADENEIEPAMGKLKGSDFADSVRRTGDDSPFAVVNEILRRAEEEDVEEFQDGDG